MAECIVNGVVDLSAEIYRSIQYLSEEAFLYIDQALNCDNQGQSEQAVLLYQKADGAINKALNVNCNGPECNGTKRIKAQALHEKLRITQTQIQTRIDELGSNAAVARALADPPPSYEDATSPTLEKGNFDELFHQLGDELLEGDGDFIDNEAVERFCLIQGVQIYYIAPDGMVSAPTYPSPLRIFQFTRTITTNQHPPAFLQVGDWTYPFLEGGSPALHSEIGAYIFPDPLADIQGSAVGLILPSDIRPDQRIKFEQMLDHLTHMRLQELGTAPAEEEYEVISGDRQHVNTSEKISKGIITAAEWMSWGIKKGAEKGGVLVRMGSNKIRDRLEREAVAHPVDPRVKQGLQVAKKATGTAVKVSACVVNKLGEATMAIGRHVAPHIRKQGEKILPKSWVSTDTPDGRSKVDGVCEVAGSGLLGFATIFNSLEHAAKILARSIRDETVVIVDHKYGRDVAGVTHDSLSAAGNTVMTAYNVSSLGTKAIAKRLAKDAGKAVVEDVNKEKLNDNNPKT